MSVLVKNILRAILFMLVQVFVLDKIVLHQMVTPYIYFLFVLWLPFKMSRAWLMIIAFVYGFILDSFQHNPGFHAAACVLIAYIRPFLVNIFIPQEGADTNFAEPSIKSMGGILPYAFFMTVLSLFHNAWLFLLEAWQFGNFWYFLFKTILSTVISILLIIIKNLEQILFKIIYLL
ncbi:MAG: rod shape-determining protein MreD [Ferruginibacter sp.]